jgi:hypothetical protein
LHPDFSIDIIDCGYGADAAREVFPIDGDVTLNCKKITEDLASLLKASNIISDL